MSSYSAEEIIDAEFWRFLVIENIKHSRSVADFAKVGIFEHINWWFDMMSNDEFDQERFPWAWVDVFSVEERKALKKFHELMCLIADIEEDDCWDESDIASRQHWVQQCKQASLTYDLFMERGHRSREDILADRDKISNEEST